MYKFVVIFNINSLSELSKNVLSFFLLLSSFTALNFSFPNGAVREMEFF